MLKIKGYLGIGTAILSVASLIYMEFDVNSEGALAAIASFYDDLLRKVFSPLQPLLDAFLLGVAEWLPIKPILLDHWRHVLVPMSIILLSDLKFEFDRGRFGQMAVTIAVGFPTITIAAALAGSAPLGPDGLMAIIWTVVGFALYHLFRATAHTLMHHHADQTVLEEFMHYFWRFTFVDLLWGAVVVVIGAVTYRMEMNIPAIALIFLFVLLLAMTYIIQPGIFVLRKIENLKDFWPMYRGLVTPRVGIWIILSLCGGILFVLSGAGLEALGS